MADPTRVFPVDTLVLHHSVTERWSNKSKPELADWFSKNGFIRGYGGNAANWSGLINPYTGGRSYAQAQFAGQLVDGSTPDATAEERAAGYRFVPLVQDPWNNVCWHAGNWPVNQKSIGVENLGDFRYYTLDENGCIVTADFWRPQDQALGGNTAVFGHREVSQIGTECPAKIMEQRDHIVALINTTPQPPTPTPSPNIQKYEKLIPKTYEFIRQANLWDFNYPKQSEMQVVKTFNQGDKIDIVGQAVYKTGSLYYMTAYSFGNADTTGVPNKTQGVNKADLKEYVPPTPPTPPVPDTVNRNVVIVFLQSIIKLMSDFVDKLKAGKE